MSTNRIRPHRFQTDTIHSSSVSHTVQPDGKVPWTPTRLRRGVAAEGRSCRGRCCRCSSMSAAQDAGWSLRMRRSPSATSGRCWKSCIGRRRSGRWIGVGDSLLFVLQAIRLQTSSAASSRCEVHVSEPEQRVIVHGGLGWATSEVGCGNVVVVGEVVCTGSQYVICLLGRSGGGFSACGVLVDGQISGAV